MPRTKDFSKVLRDKLASNRDLASAVERETFNANVAEQIYSARTSVGLTQKQLAERIGSHQSVIARLEDADYDSHSLAMLKRIAEALEMSLRVEFTPPLSRAAHDDRGNGAAGRRVGKKRGGESRRKVRRA